jgi:hypothetical protein
MTDMNVFFGTEQANLKIISPNSLTWNDEWGKALIESISY